MIIKVATLKKANVLTVDGKKISSIQEIIYDPKHKKVIGFLTSKKSLVSEAKLIPFEEISKIGKDTVLVLSELSEKKASEVGEYILKLSQEEKLSLSKGKIIGEDAMDFGSISDIFLRLKQGKLLDSKYLREP